MPISVTSMFDEPILHVKGLTAGYGGSPIIEDVGIDARLGQLTVMVGPNGAGKSTLLKTIAGVVRPSGGEVILNGSDITGKAPERLVTLGMSYVPQLANVFPSLTVMENLEMGGYVRKGGMKERASELMEMFPDLQAARRRPARTLSGGQRTMLAIARGLMLDPQTLLLDEPTAGLSPKIEAAVWERIIAIRAAGVAVVVVEQNTRRALQHADRAYVLVNGRNRIEGTGQELANTEKLAAIYLGE
jgi:ABC-type branched-subunit amino acid transport system ATPase component